MLILSEKVDDFEDEMCLSIILLEKMKGRKLKGLENLMNNICLKKPAELQKRLTKYSIQPDTIRVLTMWVP
jgi:hypothetical protein